MRKFFKFIEDINAVEFISKGLIKFTPVHELNDPAELYPVFNAQAVAASLHHYRTVGYTDQEVQDLQRQGVLLQKLLHNHQYVSAPKTKAAANALIHHPGYDHAEHAKGYITHMGRVIAEKVGIFCVSTKLDCLPLWAHHAKNARGLAVEFQNLKKTFPGDGTGILNTLKPVRYKRDYVGMTFAPSSHESIFFSKFPDWRYEKEYRVIVPLTDCEQKSFGTDQKTIYLLQIPTSCIKSIILGWNMPEHDQKKVIQITQQHHPQLPIFKAQFVDFGLKLMPV